MTRRSGIVTSLVLALALAGAMAATDEKHGAAEAVTLKGEIVDLACYLGHGARGAEHAGCAKACIKGGQPMGLVASDGKLWLLFAPHGDATAFAAAKEQAGNTVEVSGAPAERDGIRGLEVQSLKAP